MGVVVEDPCAEAPGDLLGEREEWVEECDRVCEGQKGKREPSICNLVGGESCGLSRGI